MYETFFRLHRRPFLGVPDVEHYFPASSIEQARSALLRCIDRAMGFSLVIGAPGSGKTLLLQKIAAECAARHACALLGGAQLGTSADLLRNILFELGLPYRELSEGELRLSLLDYLHSDKCRQGLLLLIDEAHALEPHLLEDVRLLTNVSRGGMPRLRLALAGCPGLEETLTHPKLESFNQRIAARCYLESLTRDETLGYIQAQLSLAGARGQIFRDEALIAIHTASGGIPRLINQLCDMALAAAATARRTVVEASEVEAAWAELQQLPTPWNDWRKSEPASKGSAANDSVVEFGLLDDEPIEVPVAPSANTAVDEAAEPRVEPSLDSIEAALRQIEELSQRPCDEARPTAGMIGPEVALDGQGCEDPFAEEFVDEEVVIDHYASLDRAAFGPKVHVCCGEGRRLAAALAKVETFESQPQPTPIELLADTPESRAASEPPAPSPAPPVVEQLEEHHVIETPWDLHEDDGDTHLDLHDHEADDIDVVYPPKEDLSKVTERYDQRSRAEVAEAGAVCGECKAVAIDETSADEAVVGGSSAAREETISLRVATEDDAPAADPHEAYWGSDDRDLIVVDEPIDEPPASGPPASRVRRQEYRQLFAQLRRR